MDVAKGLNFNLQWGGGGGGEQVPGGIEFTFPHQNMFPMLQNIITSKTSLSTAKNWPASSSKHLIKTHNFASQQDSSGEQIKWETDSLSAPDNSWQLILWYVKEPLGT